MNPVSFINRTGVVALLCMSSGCGGCEGGAYYSCAALDKARQYWDVVDATGSMEPTPVDNIPNAGIATYSGFARTLYYEDEEYGTFLDSDFNLTADFGSGTASGEMSDFQSLEAGVPGVLEISNGSIVGNDVVADVAGILGPEGLESVEYQTITVDGALYGLFLGTDAEGFSADIEGSVSYSGGGSGVISGNAHALAD